VVYCGAAKPFMRAWKERGLHPLAGSAARLVVETVPRPAADVITYIPPDGDRSLRRGHHPAQQLASELASAWGIPARPLVGRARSVARQTGMRLPDRQRNVRGAFTGATEASGRTVVLVDDVYTTGATANAAAAALRSAGARDVHVVTLARAVR
jgi:ComF family protein